MAASQNPIQGSLFESDRESEINEVEQIKTSKTSNENLSNQQLKDDAALRPRKKKNQQHVNQNIDFNQFDSAEIEEPKWSHHTFPKIDDLTPALRHYVELKIENPERILLYRLGDFF